MAKRDRFTLDIPPQLEQRLNAYTQSTGMKKAETIRRAIAEFLDRNAHGEFDTLDAARAAAADLGCTVPVDVNEDDADTLEAYTTPEGAASHVDAADWYSSVSAADLGITAETTDAELKQIATREEREQSEYRSNDCPRGIIVHNLLNYLTCA